MTLRKTTIALAAGLAAATSLASIAQAQSVKIGALGGITGPIESLVPAILDGARFAITQVNEQGGFFADGLQGEMITGDTTCADAARAADAGDRVVNVDQVVAIVGALCSGATIAVANNAAIPGGVLMISPASTSPSLTTLADNDLVFRTATSDAYQGGVLARLVRAKGVDTVAVTYVNNDYGKGFAEAFAAAFASEGGTVAANQAHEDGKADYRAEIGNLSATGAQALVVLAYADGSGQTILRQSLEGGDFSTFFGGDGMVSDTLVDNVAGIEGKITLTKPSAPEVPGRAAFGDAITAAGLSADGPFVPNGYDAAFLIALAIEKAGSADRAAVAAAVREVAMAPGEVILPGEWAKAKALIAAGTDINYEGAAGSHEFDAAGDVPGFFVEAVIADGKVTDLAPVR